MKSKYILVCPECARAVDSLTNNQCKMCRVAEDMLQRRAMNPRRHVTHKGKVIGSHNFPAKEMRI